MPLPSDPAALLAVVGSFSGALVLQQCADRAAGALFDRLGAFVAVRLGRSSGEPARPGDLTAEALADPGPELLGLARAVTAESSVLRRAARVGDVFAGARVLWVDDDPASVAHETTALQALGAEVVAVPSTERALGALAAAPFDVVVSDVARGDQPDAGLRLAAALHNHAAPVVLYLLRLDRSLGVPPFAFGVTNRPDELFHLLMDALERTRLPAPTG